jgi:tricorn protease
LTALTAAVALLALTGQAPQPAIEPRLMRFPDIHGDNIVFTYAGDLWVAQTTGGIARRLTTHPNIESHAKISPDGRTVAFTGSYDGNPEVYVVPIEGGEPVRLTYESQPSFVTGWTPDGRIVYSSTYGNFIGRQSRMWIVSPQGGMPQRTPLAEFVRGDFFADGRRVAYNRAGSFAFNWRRYRGGTQGRISIYNLATNEYSELPAKREHSFHPMVVGEQIYYISDRNLGTLNLYRHDLRTRRDEQLTRYSDGDIKYPSTDGKRIVWERDGFLYTYDLAGGTTQRINVRLLSDNISSRPMLRSLVNNVDSISISPTGVRVALEARGDIFSVPARQGDTRNITDTSRFRERFPSWSPDGQTIAYASDETGEFEIYTRPQRGGEARQVTRHGGLAVTGLRWSPDSKKLTITTRASELWLLDLETGRLTQVPRGVYGMGPHDWSPDSRWIAYISRVENQFGQLFLYEVATGKATPVTDASFTDNMPAFDLNGRYLYLVSTRTFRPGFGAFEFSLRVDDGQRVYVMTLQRDAPNPLSPEGDEEPERPPTPPETPPTPPVTPPTPPPGDPAAPADEPRSAPAAKTPPPIRIDFEGLADRAQPLPMPAGTYGIVGSNNGVLYWSGGSLQRFDMGTRQSQPIMEGVRGMMSFNPQRTKMAYYAGGTLGVIDVRPPASQFGAGRVDLGAVETVVFPREEWSQIYWEAWRFVRDNFYDPGMVGVDWRAIGNHYAQYLRDVNHRSDLNHVLGMMVAELGTGHAYVSGGDMGPTPPRIVPAQLGADYEVVGNYVRFAKIYRGRNFEPAARGPLGEPGVVVNEGDYLLEIDGRPVTARVNPHSLLLNKAGRAVTLTVNDKPTLEGARRVRVQPITDEGSLRYAEWVDENRRYVDRMSGGRIGYMHIPDTSMAGAVAFIQGFYSQTHKDAMIVDERWNGGGFVQPWFVDTLARRMRVGIQQRHFADAGDAVAIEGPKVMLINHYAGSGGDFFPWMFRQSKLGPLIGTRTWGGLVGISGGAPLVDGGSVTAPEFALYDRDTFRIVAENVGVDPDIEVDLRPDLWAKGQDAQLDRGIQYLMDQLRRMPPPRQRQEIPRIDPAGRIGG